MTRPARSIRSERFAPLIARQRVWAVSAVHAELSRLEAIHDAIEQRMRPQDGLVYLGNLIGVGNDVFGTIAELLSFRRAFIGRAGSFAADLVYLRGCQEEMWRKLLELQLAPNPRDVLTWMLDHGIGPVLTSYGFDPAQGVIAARDGPLAITRWTNGIRTAIKAAPGHANFLTALRRAAYTGNNELLFVHAGIDPKQPVVAQSDSFWWGGAGFLDLTEPYFGFKKIIRGFDRVHSGLQIRPYAVSIDRGCGFGGPLACVCFDLNGEIVESFEA